MQPDKWDVRFLLLAREIAGWSKDPSTKCGAVIVHNKRIVSVGFNGLPQKIDDKDEILTVRSKKYEMIIHAEINAILFATRSLVGCTLYTWPIPCCSRCAAIVIQSGISRVVSPPPDDRWAQSCDLGREMFREAAVSVSWLPIV